MPDIPRYTRSFLVLAVSSALALVGCAASPGQSENDGGNTAVTVVTGTDVYASIVEAVGGDRVSVTSLVNSLSQDPHSYEPTVQDKLAVSRADLVVLNGGGYDPFLPPLVEETGVDPEFVISATDVSGLEGSGSAAGGEEPVEGFNEHVWYSLPAMSRLVDVVESRLVDLDAANAAEYRDGAGKLRESLAGLEDRLHEIDAAGKAVAVTEPVPHYLLEAAGLKDLTPAGFGEAVEGGADVPVGVLRDTEALVRSGRVEFLAYNEQTAGPQTEAVRAAAVDAGLPVVNFSETVPEGEDYVSWMTGNVDRLIEGLGAVAP